LKSLTGLLGLLAGLLDLIPGLLVGSLGFERIHFFVGSTSLSSSGTTTTYGFFFERAQSFITWS